MKGFLFFTGSLIRWPVIKAQNFLILHSYIIFIYVLNYFARSNLASGTGLVFTATVCAPIFIAISKGLPLDCLDYKSAIIKEFGTESKNN